MLFSLLHLLSASLLVQAQGNSLKNCLKSLSASFPGDNGFSDSTKAFNLRLSFTPVAITFPKSSSDVQKIVSCGASSGIPVVARSGGHSYAAYGLGGANGALVVDLSSMKQISIQGANAVAQTGNKLGELATYLWSNGKLSLPHGTCPEVGVGGHTSYGGYGPFSRMEGLLLDRVVAAEVVLANGTLVNASEKQNPDLFWAIKGAAPSFGLVTSWTYSTLPAPSVTIGFSIDPPVYTTAAAFADAFKKFQSFAHDAPNELALMFILYPADDGSIGVTVLGNYFGAKSSFDTLIRPLRTSLGSGTTVNAKTFTNWLDVLVDNASGTPLVSDKPETPDNFYAKSIVINKPLESITVSTWANFLFSAAVHMNLDWWMEIDLYGGAISDFPASSSSFANRDAFLVFQIYGSATSGAFPRDGISGITNLTASITGTPDGAYPNYIDPDLSPSQWQSLYFGDNIQRLSAIKALYDPKNVFSFPQSIPLRLN